MTTSENEGGEAPCFAHLLDDGDDSSSADEVGEGDLGIGQATDVDRLDELDDGL